MDIVNSATSKYKNIVVGDAKIPENPIILTTYNFFMILTKYIDDNNITGNDIYPS